MSKPTLTLVHSVETVEDPTPGRAVLLTADAMIEDMLIRAERVRPFFVDPPNPTPLMKRRRDMRLSALADLLHDPEAPR